MKVINNSDWSVYWRTFGKDDTWYLAGLQDGIVGPNDSVTFQPIDEKVQVEFKWSNFVGKHIRRANTKDLYSDGYKFTIAADYGFSVKAPPPPPPPAPLPEPEFQPGNVETKYYGTTYEFSDLLAASKSEITQSVEFSISEARSTTSSSEETDTNSVTWGLTLSLKDETGSGVEASYENAVTQALTDRFEQQVSSSRTTTKSSSFNALGGKLNVFKCHWSTTVETGVIKCGDESYEYRATVGVSPSVELATYGAKDLGSMPEETREAWHAQTGRVPD